MALTLQKFLETFFEAKRVSEMSASKLKMLGIYTDHEGLTKSMKHIANDYLKSDKDKKGNTVYKIKPLPNAIDTENLDREDLEKLYKSIQDVLYSISQDKELNDGNNKDINELLKYPHENLMDVATSDAKNACDKISTALEDTDKDALRSVFEYALNGREITLKDFIKGLKNQKYNTDQNFQNILKTVLRQIEYNDELKTIFIMGVPGIKTTTITDGFNPPTIDGNTLDTFNYTGLLSLVYKKKTLQEAFTNHGGAKIVNAISKAKEDIAYDNPDKKDQYVPDTPEKPKGLVNKIGNKLTNFKEENLNSFGQILTLVGTRKHFSQQSKDIIWALEHTETKDKKKIRPTDGLQALIDNEANIIATSRQRSGNAGDHLAWFVKKLKEYKGQTPEAEKVFKRALYNRECMKALVSHIINKAVEENKKDEAKTAMALVSAMKYSVFTSQMADKLWKMDWDFLSKGELSKKYGAVGAITKTLDFTAKLAFVGTVRMVSAIGKADMLLNNKFRGKHTDTLDASHKQWLDNNKPHSDDLTLHEYKLLTLEEGKQNIEDSLNRLGGKDACQKMLDKYDAELKKINKLEQLVNAKQDKIDKLEEQIDSLQDTETSSKNTSLVMKLSADLSVHETELSKLENQLSVAKDNVRRTYGTYDMSDIRSLLTSWQEKDDDISAEKEKIRFEKQRYYRDDNKDPYLELMSHWDLLETHWESHQFTLAATWMQNRFLTQKSRKDPAKTRANSRMDNAYDKYVARFFKSRD